MTVLWLELGYTMKYCLSPLEIPRAQAIFHRIQYVECWEYCSYYYYSSSSVRFLPHPWSISLSIFNTPYWTFWDNLWLFDKKKKNIKETFLVIFKEILTPDGSKRCSYVQNYCCDVAVDCCYDEVVACGSIILQSKTVWEKYSSVESCTENC